MANQYLIALDLDGTLLRNDGTISEQLISYLQDLEKQGHIVCIASGRPIRAISKYYNLIGLKSPMICYNGAYITAPNNPEFDDFISTFPKDLIKEIVDELGEKHIANIMCETNDDIWLIREDSVLSDFFWHVNMNVHYGRIQDILDQDPMTMLIETTSTEADPYVVKAVEKHPHLKVRFWNGLYALFSEIYYDYISKAEGLKMVADLYKIPHDHVIAIGDACNDIEMLSFAGISVAMINGDKEVKKIASIISEFDNEHDGVMHALKKIIK